MNGFQKGLGLDGEFDPDISGLVVSAAERLFAPQYGVIAPILPGAGMEQPAVAVRNGL